MENCLKCCQRRRPDDSSKNAPNPSEFEEIIHYHGTQIPHHVKAISTLVQSWDTDPTHVKAICTLMQSWGHRFHIMWRPSLSRCNEDSERTWELQLQYGCQVSLTICFWGKERLVPRQTLLVLPIYRQHGLVVYVARDCWMNFGCKRLNSPFSSIDNMLLPLVQENPFLVCFKYIFFICSFADSVFHPHISPWFSSPK